jgi:hypothetical protein
LIKNLKVLGKNTCFGLNQARFISSSNIYPSTSRGQCAERHKPGKIERNLH